MEGFVDYRKINRAVMDNTMELCGRINSLKDSIDSSIRNEYVVYQSEPFEAGDMKPNPEMKILVSGKRTFEAAEAYKGKKVCCLDFANAYSMGGAPWSAGAQEESICRLSTLYPCLYAQKEAFYDRHIMEYDEEEMDDMGNDDLIYIPGVTVFKTDESIPKLMDEDTWFKTPDHFDTKDLFKNNIKSDRTGEDLLFQTMLDLGILLSSKIETKKINGKEVFCVEGNYLMACFDDTVDEAAITEIAKEKPYYFVMRDPANSKDGDSLITNFEQIFTTYSPDTVRKVL